MGLLDAAHLYHYGAVLNGGASYSPITVKVSVNSNAPAWRTNQVTVSGRGPGPMRRQQG